jgi:predicted aspartyl protease
VLAVEFTHDRRQLIIPVAVFHPGAPHQIEKVNALIDTGATGIGIDQDLAVALGLPKMGKEIINTPTGTAVVRLYLAGLGLYPGDQTNNGMAMPHLLPDEFIMFQCAPGSAFSLLLGMPLIGRCELTVRRNGTATLSF